MTLNSGVFRKGLFLGLCFFFVNLMMIKNKLLLLIEGHNPWEKNKYLNELWIFFWLKISLG